METEIWPAFVGAQMLRAVADGLYVLFTLKEGNEPRTIEGRACGVDLDNRTILLCNFCGDHHIPIREVEKVTRFGGQYER